MLDSHRLTRTDKVSSSILIVTFIQAVLSLTVMVYCIFGTGHMRPILVELFQLPVIPLGLSVAMFVMASVCWFRRNFRIALIVVILWCVYDIVARAWLFDGHMSTEQHERHVSFGAAFKLYFSLSLFVSVGILIATSRRVLHMSRNSKSKASENEM